MNKVIRRSDYLPRSFIELVWDTEGITVKCHFDPESRWEAPNPKFYDTHFGGKSIATYNALWWLYDVLPTDQHQRASLPSKHDDGNCLLITRSDGLTVATEDLHGEYGAEVFIGQDSPFFEKLRAVFYAIEADNQLEPLWNALELTR